MEEFREIESPSLVHDNVVYLPVNMHAIHRFAENLDGTVITSSNSYSMKVRSVDPVVAMGGKCLPQAPLSQRWSGRQPRSSRDPYTAGRRVEWRWEPACSSPRLDPPDRPDRPTPPNRPDRLASPRPA